MRMKARVASRSYPGQLLNWKGAKAFCPDREEITERQ